MVWAKAGWAVLTRLSYWTAGPPFLSLAGDVIAAPGATKYVCRLLVYSEARKAVGRLRELVHRGALLAGADIEGGRVVTLSTSASGAATQRTLTLWTLADGQCVHTVEVEGGRGGLPVLRFPHALLPTAGVGLQVWHLPTSTQVRAVPVNVLSYRVRKQFVFVLNKPSQIRVYRLKGLISGSSSGLTWWRELGWPQLPGTAHVASPGLSCAGRARLLVPAGHAVTVLNMRRSPHLRTTGGKHKHLSDSLAKQLELSNATIDSISAQPEELAQAWEWSEESKDFVILTSEEEILQHSTDVVESHYDQIECFPDSENRIEFESNELSETIKLPARIAEDPEESSVQVAESGRTNSCEENKSVDENKTLVLANGKVYEKEDFIVIDKPDEWTEDDEGSISSYSNITECDSIEEVLDTSDIATDEDIQEEIDSFYESDSDKSTNPTD